MPTKERCYPSPANLSTAIGLLYSRYSALSARYIAAFWSLDGPLWSVGACLPQYAEAVPPAAAAAAATRIGEDTLPRPSGLGPRARAATSSCDCRSCVRFSRSLRNLPCLPRREAKVAPTTWRPEMHPSTRYGTTWRGTFTFARRPSLCSALTDADCVTSGPLGNCSWQVNPPASTFWLDFLLIRSLDGL